MWHFPEIPESSGWLIIKSLLLWHPGWQVNVWKSVWHGAIVQHWVEWKLYHKSCPSAILSLPGCRTRSTSVGCLPWPQTSTWRWTASPTITGAGGVRTTTSPPGEDETPFKSLKIPFSPTDFALFSLNSFSLMLTVSSPPFCFFFFCLWHNWLCDAISHPSCQRGTAAASLRVGSVSMLTWTSWQLTTDSLGSSHLISAHLSPLSGFYFLCRLSLCLAQQHRNGKHLNAPSFRPFMLRFVSAQLKIPYSGRQ